ncbi:hypothetical protein [Desulfosporosinus sp. Sb-LF]|nr:hypothetical protein [Desulfosporosinus sp. Sb-LF]
MLVENSGAADEVLTAEELAGLNEALSHIEIVGNTFGRPPKEEE